MERTPQPSVFIGDHLPEALPAGCDYVKIDTVAAAYDMTAHLIAAGRRRLGFIGANPSPLGRQPHSSGSLRRDGFHQALDAHGIARSDAVVQEVDDWHRPHEIGRASCRERVSIAGVAEP